VAAKNDTATPAAILARFSDARCVLECGVRCLEDRQDGAASEEAVCLRLALDLLTSVYDDLDRAVSRATL
jgi:hypothetical protein